MKFPKIIFLAVLGLMLIHGDVLAQKVATYIGSGKCRACHLSAAKGAQYKVWQNARHSKAFETLGTPEAKEIAEKAGVKGDPQQAGECMVCHQTAYGVDEELIDKGFKTGLGVGCESCHGPGSLYRVVSVMNAKKFTADPEGMLAQWIELGLTIPDEETCVTCHNEKSPTFKEFDFEENFAKIAHPNPKNPLKNK